MFLNDGSFWLQAPINAVASAVAATCHLIIDLLVGGQNIIERRADMNRAGPMNFKGKT